MTLLLYDEVFLQHETPGRHPEQPERVRRAWARLLKSGVADLCDRAPVHALELAEAAALHDPAMIERAVAAGREAQQRGLVALDADTTVSPGSLAAALAAAGAACQATDAVLTGTHPNAFCLVRPPGHHATFDQSMGFCLFNNVALAAKRALVKHGVDRVLIVDWDVHHGNGTQDLFYDDPRATFLSVHRHPFYPGTGMADETGSGRGLGATFNLPLPYGTTPQTFRDRFRATLEDAARRAKPDLILLSAGFDAHRQDPVGDLGLDMEDFQLLGSAVLDVAEALCGGRVVSVLEGGYNVPVLAGCVEEHVRLLVERAPEV